MTRCCKNVSFTQKRRDAYGDWVPVTTKVLDYSEPSKGGSTSHGSWVVYMRVALKDYTGKEYQAMIGEFFFTKRAATAWLNDLLAGKLEDKEESR